jgi:hypothetical protein
MHLYLLENPSNREGKRQNINKDEKENKHLDKIAGSVPR